MQGSAPELIVLETTSTIRRLVLAGVMPAAEGAAVVRDIGETPIARTSHPSLGPR